MHFGKFEVVRHLGAGGMSTVWLARGPVPATVTAPASSHGLVVLKQQMRPDDDDGLREEARVGMQLRHPGVVQTLGCFDDDSGRPVLVLEYVAGVALAQLRRRAALPAPAVCRIGADIAEALGALHDARILHRDVTPANIIVSHDGVARLIDLGIARSHESAGKVERTATGTVKGTLRYVAPELFEGAPSTAATDLWSLGVCLFEASLGRPAVAGPEALQLAAVVRGQLLDLLPTEKLDALLQSAIARLCARDATKRFAHARDAARFLAEGDRGDGAMLASVAVYAAADQPRTTTESGSGSGSGSVSGSSSSLSAPRANDVVARPRNNDRAAPAASEDGFERMAASTYCGQDDDPFSEASQASTMLTPTADQDRLVPAPITAIVASEGDRASTTEDEAAARLRVELAPTAPYGVRLPPSRPAPADDEIEVPPTTPGTPGAVRRGPAPGDAWDIPQPITGEDDVDATSAAPVQKAPAPSPSSLSVSTEPIPLAPSPNTTPTVDTLPGTGAGVTTRVDGMPLDTETDHIRDPASSQLVDLREQAIGAPSIIAIVVIVVGIALGVLFVLSR